MLFSGVALFVPAFLAYFMQETGFIYNFGLTGFITFIIGCFLFFLSSEKDGDLRTKDGFIITIYFWTVLGFFGSIPFFLADLEGVSYIDSLFESISGLTTTGATVLVGLDEMPRSLLFYRHLLQWLGGMVLLSWLWQCFLYWELEACSYTRQKLLDLLKTLSLHPE